MPCDACKFITRPIMNFHTALRSLFCPTFYVFPTRTRRILFSRDVAPPRVHLASEFGSRLIIALSAVIYAIIMHTCGTRRHASSSDKIQLRSVTRIVPVPRNVSRDAANARWKGMDGWQSTTNRLESRESIESSAPSVIIHPRPLLPRGFELTDELFPIDRN